MGIERSHVKVGIIDYGMGNLQSVKRALEVCGASVVIYKDPGLFKSVSHMVLPGVGAFCDAMHNIREMGWYDLIRQEVLGSRIPILGICLGMQLLAEKGYEGGETLGLDLIPGTVKKLIPHNDQTHIPHVGWNEVHYQIPNPLFEGIADGKDFYFVHSYHFIPAESSLAIARTPYCGEFVSAVMNDNVYGVQFHPEKSQKAGFRLIRNFLDFG